jgi:hypothetical protein
MISPLMQMNSSSLVDASVSPVTMYAPLRVMPR